MAPATTTLLLHAAHGGSKWFRLRLSPFAIPEACATARGSIPLLLLPGIVGLPGTSAVVVAQAGGQPRQQRVCVAKRVQA